MAGFSIYTRKRKSGKPIYYVQFKKPDGNYTSGKSSGCTSKITAAKWAKDYQAKNGPFLPGKDITFQEFSKNFFNYNGQWATNKKVTGKRISERYCIERLETMKNHVLPIFGEIKLADIDKIKIRNFRNNLYSKGFSGSLINKCLYAIKAVLESAEELELIPRVPKIERASEKPKEKGILSIQEVNQLFSFQWMSKESYCHPAKPQFMGYVGNLIAASTGLRIGELQALTLKDLHLDDGYITVKKSWDNRLNKLNETTKTGRERNIFIPKHVIQALIKLLENHPSPQNPESFLFWGEKKPNEKPAEKKVFTKALYNALGKIGIDEQERKKRNITFHSWRHWLNSLLINAKIPMQKVQNITGHATDAMSKLYYHLDDMSDVRQVQESIFIKQGEILN